MSGIDDPKIKRPTGLETHSALSGLGVLASEQTTTGVQACRPEDRAMLQTEAGGELLRCATAALQAGGVPADMVPDPDPDRDARGYKQFVFPADMVLVPREPSTPMLKAGYTYTLDALEVWQDMLSAAPGAATKTPQPDSFHEAAPLAGQGSQSGEHASSVAAPSAGGSAKEITVFMCGVDYQHHLENDAYGTRVYASIEDLKERKKCWHQCGIVAASVRLVRWECEQDFNREAPAEPPASGAVASSQLSVSPLRQGAEPNEQEGPA
jgi:hypothetical protein